MYFRQTDSHSTHANEVQTTISISSQFVIAVILRFRDWKNKHKTSTDIFQFSVSVTLKYQSIFHCHHPKQSNRYSQRNNDAFDFSLSTHLIGNFTLSLVPTNYSNFSSPLYHSFTDGLYFFAWQHSHSEAITKIINLYSIVSLVHMQHLSKISIWYAQIYFALFKFVIRLCIYVRLIRIGSM